MKKKILVSLGLICTLSLAACGADSNNEKDIGSSIEKESTTETISSENQESTKKVSNDESAEAQYQSVLDEYSAKLKEASPILVAEYNAEYPNNQNGLEGLASLSNSKIEKLAEISNDGISKMAEIHLKAGGGSYEEYEQWATKLTDIYTKEAEQITNAYMQSAQ